MRKKYQRHNSPEVVTGGGGSIGEPPAALDSVGKQLWQTVAELVPEQVLRQADRTTLTGMCEWWSQWRRIQEAMRELSPTDGEYYKLNQMSAVCWKHFSTTAAKFGLSPSDRAKLGIASPEKEIENPFNKIRRDLGMPEIRD